MLVKPFWSMQEGMVSLRLVSDSVLCSQNAWACDLTPKFHPNPANMGLESPFREECTDGRTISWLNTGFLQSPSKTGSLLGEYFPGDSCRGTSVGARRIKCTDFPLPNMLPHLLSHSRLGKKGFQMHVLLQ